MWIFLELAGGGGWWPVGVGSDELLLDGYIYPDSNYTEWKLVVQNVCILNFMTIPTPVIFLRPINP